MNIKSMTVIKDALDTKQVGTVIDHIEKMTRAYQEAFREMRASPKIVPALMT